MAIFDSWVPQLEPLSQGVTYRCSYQTVCLNAVGNDDVRAALAAQAIVTDNPNLSGPISTGVAGRTFNFRVTAPMSLTEFAGRVNAAFHAASQNSLLDCWDVSVGSIERLQAGDGLGGNNPLTTGFGLGSLVTVLVIGGVAFMVWKAAK